MTELISARVTSTNEAAATDNPVNPTPTPPHPPSPTGQKRPSAPPDDTPPTKKIALGKPSPDGHPPTEFWVTVWYNGERSTDLATVKTHVSIAAIIATNDISNCDITKNEGLCSMYRDDNLWFKATLHHPPQSAKLLFNTPVVVTRQSIVAFTPYPCLSTYIPPPSVSAIKDGRDVQLTPEGGIKALPIVKDGRPFTWHQSILINLNRSVAESKRNRVVKPVKHIFHELIELNYSLEGLNNLEEEGKTNHSTSSLPIKQ